MPEIDTMAKQGVPHYEPFGWEHWPEFPWMSYQFRRALGETQEGGGAVSECFQAASRMIPGDDESWYTEWTRVAEKNFAWAEAAERKGHINTARNCYLRAVDEYRQAEFWLDGHDPRRLATFDRIEAAFRGAMQYFTPPGEVVQIPYEGGKHLPAYFLAAPTYRPGRKMPVLVSFGGLDSFKDELYFMTAKGALERGISCLLVDGPGQGGAIRRQGIVTRFDYEVPVGKCIDYLESRDDVDVTRIAISGTSLGGYYVARAAAFEHRLAAVIAHGAVWDVAELWEAAGEKHGLAKHIKWVFGAKTIDEATLLAKDFKLEPVVGKIQAPFLVIHGGHDVLGVVRAQTVYDAAKAAGVDVTLDLLSEDETGAEHCQHDNPTLGEERMMDWLVDKLGIDEREVQQQKNAVFEAE